MMDLKPIPIILVSIYCFLIGLFFISVTVNAVIVNNGVVDPYFWVPVGAFILSALVFIALGIGILFYNKLSFKVLLFLLMIFIATVISFLLDAMIFFCLDRRLFSQCAQNVHLTPVGLFCFAYIFLSGFIVMFYLTRPEVVEYFGDMGQLIEPF